MKPIRLTTPRADQSAEDARRFMRLLTAASLVTAGIVGGAMLAIQVAVVPAQRELPDAEGIAVHRQINHFIDPFMPIHAFLSLGMALLLIMMRRSHRARALEAAAAGLTATVAVISVRWNVPINRRVNEWETTAVSPEWPVLRDRWASAHRKRTIAGMLALVCSGIAAVVSEPPRGVIDKAEAPLDTDDGRS